MGNLLNSLFPEEGQLARLRAAVTGQGATPERLFSTMQEPDRFAGAPVGNSSVYWKPQESVVAQSPEDPRGNWERLVTYLDENPSPYMTKQLLREGVKALASGPMALEKTARGRYEGPFDPQLTTDMVPLSVPFGVNALFTKPSNALFTLAGVGAKLTDHAALRRAKQLEASGALPETIWNATDFHRDKAGNWLWEIDDSGMKLKTHGPRQDQTWMDKNDSPGLYETLPGGYGSPESLYPHFPDGTKVGDVISHPELFANYPHLADMPLKDNPWAGNVLGAYDPGNKQFYINAGKKAQILGTVVHEFSHGVQHFEELPGGGNPQQFLPTDFSAKKTYVNDQLDQVKQMVSDNLGNRVPQQELDDIFRIEEFRQAGGKMPKAWQEKLVNFANNHSHFYDQLEHALRQKENLTMQEREAYLKYRALHGEQTANAAGERVGLTPLQRKHRPFWEDYTLPQDNHLMGNVEFWKP